MHPSLIVPVGVEVAELYRYASDQIAMEDINAFVPSDPETGHYIRILRNLKHDCRLPNPDGSDIEMDDTYLTEALALTLYSDAKETANEQRFRRFRVFTNSICLGTSWTYLTDFVVFNYILARLLDDAEALGDQQLNGKIESAFCALHRALMIYPDRVTFEEFPFLVIARLIMCNFPGALRQDCEDLIPEFRIVEREAHERWSHTPDLLWGLTNYDTLFPVWRDLIQRHLACAPAESATKLLADELLLAA